MTRGLLVQPDLSRRVVDFELDDAAELLGGPVDGRVSVVFQEEGDVYAALYSAGAAAAGAEPNPVASLARNEAATGNSAFLPDPTRAISGPVLFVGADGEDIDEETVARVDDAVRAVEAYREDEPEDFALWRAAVLNLAN
ncbi:hypothetical protein [Corynebacterium frankenforstense]